MEPKRKAEDGIELERMRLAADIVAAYCSNNNVQASDLPGLITAAHQALIGAGQKTEAPEPEKPIPAISVKKSIQPEFLICLEDGKKLKMLKRHLRSAYNMTPEEYREKWSLPSDYPMVAPDYAKQRSALAKRIGLGRKVS